MAIKKTEKNRLKGIADFSSIAMIIFLSAAYIIETYISHITVNYSLAGLVMVLTTIIIIAIIKNSINHYKMAFNVPFILLLFYTALMTLSKWYDSHYMIICLFLCAISCIYSHFNRTLFYIIVQNLFTGYLIFVKGYPVNGHVPLFTVLVIWLICLFSSIIMLLLTRTATIVLSKALEHQNSFMDLLASTENIVAMIDEHNEIVYASKTLSDLANTEDPTLVQGRPLIDLFPGRSLKNHAGKLLKEKDEYAEDWEFSLNGQKRYFKAASHNLPGGGGTLISLYDMTHLAERDEIAVMKDSMKIGLFFMDKNYIIQDHYSRYLEELLSDTKLFGKNLMDIISDSVTPSESEAIKDYFNMVLERTYDQEMLDDINPLNELHYANKETGVKKVFQFAFATVERGHGEVFLLVTIYDITTRVELQERLAEEEAKRQEEMQSVFELIQVEPDVFSDFMADMEHELDEIVAIQKNDSLSTHDSLVKTYQSVHAIKSNAVILGLNVFGNKVHNLESKIKKLREIQGTVPFGEMLNLTMEIDKITQEKNKFKDIIGKIQSYAGDGKGKGAVEKQNVKVLIESLAKTTSRVAEDLGKQIKFVSTDIDSEAIDKGPRRVIKEILMQLIRNSALHGIETPEERKAKGKKEEGTIRLSIKMTEDHKNVHVRLTDDGRGLNYKKIAERALEKGLIKKEDATNNDVLMKVIFMPGFSTADTETVHGGRGIGLNLVRDRIKEIKGNIKLKSEPDKGTLFFISLPI